MIELALNILDIATNSVKAKASLVEITVKADVNDDKLTIIIKDENNAVIGDEITYEKDNYTLCINCYVKLGDNENIKQKFIVEIENEEIAQLRDFLYKIATLQVEIECESDNNTYKNNVA